MDPEIVNSRTRFDRVADIHLQDLLDHCRHVDAQVEAKPCQPQPYPSRAELRAKRGFRDYPQLHQGTASASPTSSKRWSTCCTAALRLSVAGASARPASAVARSPAVAAWSSSNSNTVPAIASREWVIPDQAWNTRYSSSQQRHASPAGSSNRHVRESMACSPTRDAWHASAMKGKPF